MSIFRPNLKGSVTYNYLQKNCKLHKLQLPIVFFKKSIILDMHHRIAYMYINFQRNRVSVDQSKLCTQSYLQNIVSCINLQLAIRLLKPNFFQTCIIGQPTCISIFSKIGLVVQSKPCTQSVWVYRDVQLYR